ncbi:MAG: menaquinone biosynthesis protein [Nitrospiraceae bacterium]|nr:menaquinone biosynthesis protein [Nitrospiraceae bacterium]
MSEKRAMPGQLRIGRIFYLNLYPIFHGLDETVRDGRYVYLDGHPALVNKELRGGGVDASPSSSIVYLKNPEDFSLIEGHSISADGPIRSIYLFSRYPIEELGGRLIGVTNQTETSAALLRIILKKFHSVDCEIRVTALTAVKALDKIGQKLDKGGRALDKGGAGKLGAYLAIGDDAMRAWKKLGEEQSPGSPGGQGAFPLLVYDLGGIWRDNTGLPFVFALWIARKDRVAEKMRAFEQFRRDLDRAKDYALSHFEDAARQQPVRELSRKEVIEYWGGITYGLGPSEKKGLRLFGKYARELGLL